MFFNKTKKRQQSYIEQELQSQGKVCGNCIHARGFSLTDSCSKLDCLTKYDNTCDLHITNTSYLLYCYHKRQEREQEQRRVEEVKKQANFRREE